MTSETRTLIDISDIVAIEFECPSCHTKIVEPITVVEDENRKGLPAQCPICSQRLFSEGVQLTDTIKRFRAFLQNFPGDIRVPMKLQIRETLKGQ